MRAPDIEALLYHYKNGDPQATLNLMAAFCRSSDGVSVGVAAEMAAVIRILGPTVQIAQHERNLILKRKIELEAKDRGSREKAYIALADESVGVDRLRQIDRGEPPKQLLDFVLMAEERRDDISSQQLAAAQEYIARIRRQLLDGGGKSRGKRSKLLLMRLESSWAQRPKAGLVPVDSDEAAKRRELKEMTSLNETSWGDLGKSRLDKEHYADVEALIAQGIKPGKAFDLVAARTGDDAKKIKTNYFREAFRQRQRFIDTRMRLLEVNLEFSKLNPAAPREATPTIEEIRDSLEKADLTGFGGSVSKVPPKPY